MVSLNMISTQFCFQLEDHLVYFPILFGIGIDPVRSTFNLLKNYKIVKHQGNTFDLSFKKYRIIGVGENNFLKKLEKNMKEDEFVRRLNKHIERHLSEGDDEGESDKTKRKRKPDRDPKS